MKVPMTNRRVGQTQKREVERGLLGHPKKAQKYSSRERDTKGAYSRSLDGIKKGRGPIKRVQIRRVRSSYRKAG